MENSFQHTYYIRNVKERFSGGRTMIPDGNMDLHSTMNSTRINVSKIIFFLILNAIKLEIITGRYIYIYFI